MIDIAVPAQLRDSVASEEFANRLRASAPHVLDTLRARLASRPRQLTDPCGWRSAHAPSILVVGEETLPASRPVWFIGDVHGDIVALEAAWYVATNASGPEGPLVVLLGDLIDDGPRAFECVLRVLQLFADHPGQVLMLPGNHDLALKHGSRPGSFDTDVSPGDFAEWLNDATTGALWPEREEVASLFIDCVATLPRACFLWDGLLLAHGGVPQADVTPGLIGLAGLEDPRALDDFVWVRLHPRAKQRQPERSSRGVEVGRLDFEGFCERSAQVLGLPVTRMIRGHDHLPGRYGLFEQYQRYPVVTLNTMGPSPRDLAGDAVPTPCMARWVPGALPVIYRLLDLYPAGVNAQREDGTEIDTLPE